MAYHRDLEPERLMDEITVTIFRRNGVDQLGVVDGLDWWQQRKEIGSSTRGEIEWQEHGSHNWLVGEASEDVTGALWLLQNSEEFFRKDRTELIVEFSVGNKDHRWVVLSEVAGSRLKLRMNGAPLLGDAEL